MTPEIALYIGQSLGLLLLVISEYLGLNQNYEANGVLDLLKGLFYELRRKHEEPADAPVAQVDASTEPAIVYEKRRVKFGIKDVQEK